MAYTGMELFMENLKMLIYNNDNPVINNHPSVLSKRSEILLLYEELSSMIQILFVEKENDIHELEEVRNLKKRFRDLAEEVHNTIGLFVYVVNFKSKYDSIEDGPNFKSAESSYKYKYSLDLKNVMKSVKSIRKQLDKIPDKLKMVSSRSINRLKTESVSAAGISGTKNPVRMKKVLNNMVVGLKHDAGLIRDKLVEDQKQLDVVSIVGTGGIGKTTLAAKVFNDPFVVYHFHVRVWVTVSQTYEKQDLLIQILSFMDVQLDLASASYSRLREVLHKSLMGKRYLIVIDDIWSNEAWDDLKLYFPNSNIGSRILLTSRLKEVALYAKSHGFIHQLEYLTDEESWELLCKKVFLGVDCPEWLKETGMLIAKNCHGLPLAVVVIAGILAKEALTKDSWEKIAQSVNSYVVSDRNGFLDMLALSYDHLPPHLKNCFLYLGAFPEDDKFQVRRLIWLWMAEGFIQEDGNRTLETIGEEYLGELVNRNLVIVADRKLNGGIKACYVHDLLRELCLKKATQEGFFLKINTQMSCLASMRPRRIFTNVDFFANNYFDKHSPTVRSLVCLHSGGSMINIMDKHFYAYPLLMVLDLQKCKLYDFPKAIELLVHLRYIAFWYMRGFPSSLCNLWSLQTIVTKSVTALWLPNTISNLVNLRHLKSDKDIYFNSIEKPMNLQTISNVKLGNGAGNWVKYIPAIKTLKAMTRAQDDHDFETLTSLETLVWVTIGLKGFVYGKLEYPKIHMRLPTSLRKLSLTGCYLPWSDMSIVQSLPNLEVLKILDNAFLGPRWETGESEFQQLKYLKLQGLCIQHWEASSINFPCLKQLVLDRCKHLEEIPLELGDIPTLQLIDVDDYNNSVIESLGRIWEEQQNLGNYDLKINVRRRWTSNFLLGKQERSDSFDKRWMAFLIENQEKSDFGDGCIKPM
ncbi:putative P-loop containing nucleoside triphosphate hydrolase, leucine-rich repeat domain superfamily [Helianthus annuus]|uniref:P-loop containing nucleoside triphosphate hydrolase, leucine-rich repeat domain superfamily n=1 Tax=Helianthus annuus TaxID=4232 RepID=A0A251T7C1_HELAN|nr:putative late blight resistance protein homolog R1B-17 [Helianthus annuus]KAF5778557.1 putative P-loop containing nucleoside triphosphate hydrolase, leucine-rich repeat domain superfamily [Helianthus annuus]KAJ0493991.1 putative P-loop containing nucleoside triphosphate hydrolase, leucine-rich repeat domain superfamily [Helianthus annuus]KAJ0505867.1 putative P-loop containing nucleoside triphosphate hydrolase, leucine-rich repeat domain superfamily [Helianthus annuus]KAJ0675540.1 putative P